MSIGKSKVESRLPSRAGPRPFAVTRSAFAEIDLGMSAVFHCKGPPKPLGLLI